MNLRLQAILAKIETTYGTDAVPVGATDAVLVAQLNVKPMENEMVERAIVLAWLGQSDMVPVATRVSCEFVCEMVGSGTAGTAPAWGKLLRAAGFAETISAGVSAAYSPISASFPSLTIYYHMDGVRHIIVGARATKLGLKTTPRGIPYLEFGFMGLYGGISDQTFPTQTLTAWKVPIAVNNANTGAFTLHGYSGKLYDQQIDLNPQTVYRNIVGASDVLITDRSPGGKVVIEEPTVTAKDFWTIARTPTLAALSLTHGVTAGFKVKIDAPNVQLLNPVRENRDNIAALSMGLRITPTSAGNDELTITNI